MIGVYRWIYANGSFISLLATAIIAIFQVALWRATSKQLAVVKQEFIATHRPKIRVRGFISKSETLITQPGFEIINVGETAGSILGSHFRIISAANESEAIAQFDDTTPNNLIPQREMKAGESIRMNELPFSDDVKSAKLKYEAGGGRIHLFAIGWIQYGDKNGALRRTGFCRRYESKARLYRVSADVVPDFEYED
jgi:hypothetical protein